MRCNLKNKKNSEVAVQPIRKILLYTYDKDVFANVLLTLLITFHSRVAFNSGSNIMNPLTVNINFYLRITQQ